MGSINNAASLGAVGIVIAFNQKSYQTFLKVVNYLGFLVKVEKNSYNMQNFLILNGLPI
jgi:hypothetical protein